jgi:succinate dehydrogenase flavin-adding protein (antitoxin of CptAB toxin-antitoxin module)
MKELDVLLERYLTREYIEADAARRSAFAKLLELQDPQLHAYLLDGVLAPDPAIRDVVRSITRSAP